MAVETGQAIITAIYSRLTADATMKSLLSDPVRLYRVMAPKDPDFPYLVHRADPGSWPIANSGYYLDVWYYGQDSAPVDSIVERIRTLLENWRITTGDNEMGAGRMIFNGKLSGYVGTDAQKVWRYEMRFMIKYVQRRYTELAG